MDAPGYAKQCCRTKYLITGGVRMSIKRLVKAIMSIMPLFIIGGLLYVALYVKPQPGLAQTNPYPVVKRDRFYGVASPTPTTVWAVGSHGKIVRSDNSGDSWALQSAPESEHLQGIAAWDDKRAIVVGNAGLIMVTSDGGKSWTKVKTPLDEAVEKHGEAMSSTTALSTGETSMGGGGAEQATAAEAARKSAQKLLKIAIVPDGNAWVVGEMGIVLHSKDFGATWERSMKPEDVAWNGVAVIGNKVFLVGETGRMKRSEDGGGTWSDVKSPVKGSLIGVAFRDEANGVAVGLQGVVMVTKDGGKSWTEVPKATIEHLFDIIWDGTEWVAVGDKGVMVKGDSSGADWKGKRITDLDTSWYTEVVKSGNRYYLSGARLAVLEKGELKFFDKKI